MGEQFDQQSNIIFKTSSNCSDTPTTFKDNTFSFLHFSLFNVRWDWGMGSASTRTQTCPAAVFKRRPLIVCRWSSAAVETTTSRTGLRFSGSAIDIWTSPPRTSRSEWMMIHRKKEKNDEGYTAKRSKENRGLHEWEISRFHIQKGQTICQREKERERNDIKGRGRLLKIDLAFTFEENDRHRWKG